MTASAFGSVLPTVAEWDFTLPPRTERAENGAKSVVSD